MKLDRASSLSSMSSSALFHWALRTTSSVRHIGPSSRWKAADLWRGGDGIGDVGRELLNPLDGGEENMKGGLDDRSGEEDKYGGEDGGSGGDEARKSSTGPRSSIAAAIGELASSTS